MPYKICRAKNPRAIKQSSKPQQEQAKRNKEHQEILYPVRFKKDLIKFEVEINFFLHYN
jgi:hypothetical protein